MGRPAIDFAALRSLSVAERIQLVEDLWDSIALETPEEALPLSPELAAKLDRRLADIDAGREKTLSMDEVRARILGEGMHGP